MARPDETPRDLLFGLLALQIGLIDQDQLVSAFSAWTRAKGKTLAEVLFDRGAIDAESRSILATMAEKQLKLHGGDTEKSLAAVAAGPSTRARLTALGDTDLTRSVALVGSHTPSSDATATMSVGTATSDGQRFRVLRPHAQGGLGAVFVALDGELNREVALKQILDHHADDPTSRTRFLIEAEITGGLEHPGIVPVYGLGHYGDGRPYYAMRFIRGDSLKEAIAEFHADALLEVDPGKRSLALRKLLRRFVDVCNAIDYAHGRGVLHRDLKPGNVIVGKYGETLVVDWGLAKPMDRPEVGGNDERTLIPSSSSGSAETLPGSAIGTPAYMSPEQASGDLEALGPRSDVYSLGATLYCLLTGKAPFEGTQPGTILREVQKGSFPPPRQIEPAIDKALEAVCLKAMATRPEDRYATARALAEDVERWAADEPTSAWCEPTSVRARRWMRRNRTAVAAAAVALLATLFGTAAVLAVQTRANADLKKSNEALNIANAKESKANADLTRANVDLAAAKDREAARFTLAKDAIRLFHGEVGDDLVLKEDQFKPLRDKLLEGAVEFYQKLEGQLKDQPDRPSRKAMGDAYQELGELTEKIGDQPAAVAIYGRALALRRQLASEPGADEESILDVPRSLVSLGFLQKKTGDAPGAKVSLEEAVHLAQDALARNGQSEPARNVAGKAYHYYATIFHDTGDLARAMEWDEKALAIRQALASAHPESTQFQAELANTYNNNSLDQVDLGKYVEALESYRKALAIQQRLADANPGLIKFEQDVAGSCYNLGALQQKMGQLRDSLDTTRRALAIYQKLADANPSVSSFLRGTSLCHQNIAGVLTKIGDKSGSLDSSHKALGIQQKLIESNPGVSHYQRDLASTLAEIATKQAEMGDSSAARDAFGKALTIQRKLVDANPRVIEFRSNLATTALNFSEFLRRGRSPAEARDGYSQALEAVDALLKATPEHPFYQIQLAYGLRGRGLARLDLMDYADAASDIRLSLGAWEKMKQRAGWEWFQVACCHATLSNLAGRVGSGIQATEAAPEAEQAKAILRKAFELGFRDFAEYRSEAAFDPLRDREDFKKLIEELEKKLSDQPGPKP
jgi:serine/threonine-protein kinase